VEHIASSFGKPFVLRRKYFSFRDRRMVRSGNRRTIARRKEMEAIVKEGEL
jgi:hypothetical protein